MKGCLTSWSGLNEADLSALICIKAVCWLFQTPKIRRITLTFSPSSLARLANDWLPAHVLNGGFWVSA